MKFVFHLINLKKLIWIFLNSNNFNNIEKKSIKKLFLPLNPLRARGSENGSSNFG